MSQANNCKPRSRAGYWVRLAKIEKNLDGGMALISDDDGVYFTMKAAYVFFAKMFILIICISIR